MKCDSASNYLKTCQLLREILQWGYETLEKFPKWDAKNDYIR